MSGDRLDRAYDEREVCMSVSTVLLVPTVNVRTFRPANVRRILCVFPAYSEAFGTFDHAFPLMGPVKAFMPPQGILFLAALIPREWQVQFVDENIRSVAESELAWADAVLVSGMHIQ